MTFSTPTSENLGGPLEALGDEDDFACEIIGHSRQGRPLFGLTAGTGPLHISITAGAHSDEPGGPLAALALLRWLAAPEGQRLLPWTTWRVCPQINPDGAILNAAWFADPPDLLAYARGVWREAPGDDVEFNYPGDEPGAKAPRPENVAVAGFLRGRGPYHLHLSLHGMAFASGAWWLIGREWIERTAPLRPQLAGVFEHAGLGRHDWDRRGEKGFTRIEPGFATTPTSTAMRAHFQVQGQLDTAALFLPSSMEFVQSLGGDPLVMVSEVPLFRIGAPSPSPEDSALDRLRGRLPEARAQLLSGDDSALRSLAAEFHLAAIPFATQVNVIASAVITTVRWLERRMGLTH